MSTPASAVVVRAPDRKAAYAAIAEQITTHEARIVSALTPTVSRQRFMAVALQAVTRSPRLRECPPASFVLALIDAAELGLVPSGLMGSAYLVPYRNGKSKRYEAKLIPGYRGLIDLARRSGEVATVEAQIVRQRDAFEYQYGTGQFLRHVPYLNLTGERGPETVDDRGETRLGALLDGGPYVAVWARAVLAAGQEQFDVKGMPFIEGIRRRSKSADEGPWVSDYEAMARKTMARQLLKYLPLSVDRLTRALELEDEAESDAAAPEAAPSPARSTLQAALGIAATPEEPGDEAESDAEGEQAVDPDADEAEPVDGEFKAADFDKLDF
mgnify:CR=1 FL=1